MICKFGNNLLRINLGIPCVRKISNDAKVGFVGLGNMGGFMALNLANKGHKVVAYDVSADRLKTLADQAKGNIEAAQSIAGVTKDVKAIVTVLPSSKEVIDVYKGPNGILAAASKSTLMIDATTGDPDISRQIANDAKSHGCNFIDAPVSGGVNAARDGNLTFIVGGEKEDVDKAKVLLEKMGQRIFHSGPNGNGLAAKLCNNMLLAISMIGVSEAMILGKQLGLESKVLANILNNATGRCWSTDTYNPVPGVMEGVPASRDYEGGFGCALMAKDLGLAQSASIDRHVSVPLGSMALQMYRLLCKQGFGDKDFGAVYKYLSEVKK